LIGAKPHFPGQYSEKMHVSGLFECNKAAILDFGKNGDLPMLLGLLDYLWNHHFSMLYPHLQGQVIQPPATLAELTILFCCWCFFSL